MAAASIYVRPEAIYVASLVKSTSGMHRTGAHFSRLPSPAERIALGNAVLVALSAYSEGAPDELYVRGVKRPLDPLLAFAGFRSWKSFERGAAYFSVTSEGDMLTIIPSAPAPRGGFLHEPAKAVRCEATAEAVGAAVLSYPIP